MPRKMLPPPTTRHKFDALRLGRGDLPGQAGDRFGIDPELARPHQRFARQLEQDAIEAREGHSVRVLQI